MSIFKNPETAAYPSMPLSLPPTAVDQVVEMEQIGPLLHDMLKGARLPMTEKAEDPLRDLLTQVSGQTNIDFRNYKSSTILRRIGRRMAVRIDQGYRYRRALTESKRRSRSGLFTQWCRSRMPVVRA